MHNLIEQPLLKNFHIWTKHKKTIMQIMKCKNIIITTARKFCAVFFYNVEKNIKTSNNLKFLLK